MLLVALASDLDVLREVAPPSRWFTVGTPRPGGASLGRRLLELEPSEIIQQRYRALQHADTLVQGTGQTRTKQERLAVVNAIQEGLGDLDDAASELLREYALELQRQAAARATLLRLAAWSNLDTYVVVFPDQWCLFLPVLVSAVQRMGGTVDYAPAAHNYLAQETLWQAPMTSDTSP